MRQTLANINNATAIDAFFTPRHSAAAAYCPRRARLLLANKRSGARLRTSIPARRLPRPSPRAIALSDGLAPRARVTPDATASIWPRPLTARRRAAQNVVIVSASYSKDSARARADRASARPPPLGRVAKVVPCDEHRRRRRSWTRAARRGPRRPSPALRASAQRSSAPSCRGFSRARVLALLTRYARAARHGILYSSI